MEYKEYEGKWWLPGDEDNKVYGTLKFYPNERLELELKDTFEDLPRGEHPEYTFILGKDFSNKKITLYKSRETLRRDKNLGKVVIESKYYVHTAFIGTHIKDEQEIAFEKIEIKLNNLNEWLGFSGLNLEEDNGLIIPKYEDQDNIENVIDDEFELNFNFKLVKSDKQKGIKGAVDNEISLKEESWLEIRRYSNKSLESYFKIIEMFEIFLFISTQSVIHFTEINGTKEDSSCNILIQNIRNKKNLENKYRFSMPLVYDKISDNFGNIISNLHKTYQNLETLFDLYHGVIVNQHMFPRQEFLFLVNALEYYHRNRFEDQYIPEDEYEKEVYDELVKAISGDIPDGLNESLKSRLEYHNEYSLKKRLDEILEEYKRAIDLIVSNRDRFSNRVKEIRHYYSHYFEPDEKITVEEVYNKKEKLKSIVEICILGEIDEDLLDDRDLIEKLEKNKKEFAQM